MAIFRYQCTECEYLFEEWLPSHHSRDYIKICPRCEKGIAKDIYGHTKREQKTKN